MPPTRFAPMTVIPTRRPWLTSGRVVAAVLLLSLASSTLLLITGVEADLPACMASAQ